MTILVQQDGRIQLTQAFPPDRYTIETVELATTLPVYRQYDARVLPHDTVPVIRRTFRRLGTEGNVTIFVEIR